MKRRQFVIGKISIDSPPTDDREKSERQLDYNAFKSSALQAEGRGKIKRV